ncbi:MAG TPA: ankyrin repeat domain-containing protein [Gemmatimonadales bacterium]|jgi:ankyrin repeat protein
MLEEILEACRRNDLERVQSLVTADPTLLTRQGATGETPLLTALYHRSGETVSWLSGQQWPRTVFEAAAIDDAARLEMILAADPGLVDTYAVDGWTPLHLAAFFGSVRAAQFLLVHGADPRRIARNAMANTPLHAAVAAKRVDLVPILLDAGADPALECAGYTPLAIAEVGGFEAGAALIRQALARGGSR